MRVEKWWNEICDRGKWEKPRQKHIHFVSFISPCDGASGVVGRHPCYSLTYNIGASSHLIPWPGLVLDTSWGYLFIYRGCSIEQFEVRNLGYIKLAWGDIAVNLSITLVYFLFTLVTVTCKYSTLTQLTYHLHITTVAQIDGHQPQCKHDMSVQDSAALWQISLMCFE